MYQTLMLYQLVNTLPRVTMIKNTHAKFTLIETIKNGNKTTEVIQDILRKLKNFSINRLENLPPHGLNQVLNP